MVGRGEGIVILLSNPQLLIVNDIKLPAFDGSLSYW